MTDEELKELFESLRQENAAAETRGSSYADVERRFRALEERLCLVGGRVERLERSTPAPKS